MLALQPEGEGRYTWADGSTYEGAWNAGLKHGWGKYRWPNGASYQGEWRDGFMQVRGPRRAGRCRGGTACDLRQAAGGGSGTRCLRRRSAAPPVLAAQLSTSGSWSETTCTPWPA
jgi:hypothetical protein